VDREFAFRLSDHDERVEKVTEIFTELMDETGDLECFDRFMDSLEEIARGVVLSGSVRCEEASLDIRRSGDKVVVRLRTH